MKVYNWKNILEESPRAGVRRQAFRGSNVIIVRNELEPGMQTFPHIHDFEQLALIVSGRVRFRVGDEVHEIGPGSIFLIPAGVEHFAEPIGNEAVVNIDIFSPVRKDYLHLVKYQEEKFES
jgi:quercetin dioxygenase-like cupin family protein